jgi:4-amino-4-deoxy-L-arabinose transferase-like glycosyltransferase
MPPSRRAFLLALLGILAAGAVLRVLWLTADPPTHATVGIVWHDEGPWVHNARNRVLWGMWRTDNWNPVFIAPVFTALEYVAFSLFGVGTWQARTVPVASGLVAIVALGIGLRALAGSRAGVIGAALLATNYVFVMWNRAALMESTMTAFIVVGWAAYAVASRRAAAGLVAGAAAILAFFSKASAIFFVAAIAADACLTVALSALPAMRMRLGIDAPRTTDVRAAWLTLGGARAAGLAIAIVFVWPHLAEYRFYNWQMSVTRKPEYTLRALADRASWLPIAHDFFTRMWLVTAASAVSIAAVIAGWRRARPAERLLVMWVAIGLLELIVHDSGNERRYVMFVPALVALAAALFGRSGPLLREGTSLSSGARWVAAPMVLGLAYLVIGAVVRLAFLYEIGPGVRLAAGLSLLATAIVIWKWNAVVAWGARQRASGAGIAIVVGLAIVGDLAQYVQWTLHRTSLNYEASRMLRSVLPPGTLVHGKLANGLALENLIKPVFVGRGFGNYDDRLQRDDVRFVLTYESPRVGYEGPVITEVLDHYPNRMTILTFPVAETRSGHDRAALIDKFGGPRRAGPDVP